MTAVHIAAFIAIIILSLFLIPAHARIDYCGDLIIEVRYLFLHYLFVINLPAINEPTDSSAEPVKKEPVRKKKKRKRRLINLLEKPEFPGIVSTLKLLRDFFNTFTKRFFKHTVFEKFVIKANIATDDPAKTAVIYGIVCPIAAEIYAATNARCFRKKKNAVFIQCVPDFISEKTDLLIDIRFRTNSARLLTMIFILISYVRKYYAAGSEKKKSRAAAKAAEKEGGKGTGHSPRTHDN